MVGKVVSAWKAAIEREEEPAHVDAEFLKTHFAWNPRKFGCEVNVEPFPFWGSHDTENYISRFSRELGIASLNAARLRPKLVCLSSIDPGKLRPIVRSIQASIAQKKEKKGNKEEEFAVPTNEAVPPPGPASARALLPAVPTDEADSESEDAANEASLEG